MKRGALWCALIIVLLGAAILLEAQADIGEEISQALVDLQSQGRGIQARAHDRLVCMGTATVRKLLRLLSDETCPVLARLARTAVLNWVYEPIIISGISQAYLIKIIFQFAPHGLIAIKEDFSTIR